MLSGIICMYSQLAYFSCIEGVEICMKSFPGFPMPLEVKVRPVVLGNSYKTVTHNRKQKLHSELY